MITSFESSLRICISCWGKLINSFIFTIQLLGLLLFGMILFLLLVPSFYRECFITKFLHMKISKKAGVLWFQHVLFAWNIKKVWSICFYSVLTPWNFGVGWVTFLIFLLIVFYLFFGIARGVDGYYFGYGNAVTRDWLNIWIKSDSKVVIRAFQKSDIIPWDLWNKWNNCLIGINVNCSHIYHEENTSATKLVAFGHTLIDFTWYTSPAYFIKEEFNRDKLEYPSYLFS